MYTVMVVDDEPAALNHLCKIIRKIGTDFCILDTAGHGAEALEKMEAEQPDLLFTDVKMPVMDGLRLVREVKDKYPDVLSYVISGYQEFEYVKEAIQSGVCDYLLKPVIPSGMEEVLAQAESRLDETYYRKRCGLMKRLCQGKACPGEELRHYFQDEWYYSALVRKNGLPRRFMEDTGIEVFSAEAGHQSTVARSALLFPRATSQSHACMALTTAARVKYPAACGAASLMPRCLRRGVCLYGRDEMEGLYVCPASLLGQKSFTSLMDRCLERDWNSQGYNTCIISREAFHIEELPVKAKKLYKALNKKSAIGLNQRLILEELKPEEKREGASQSMLLAMGVYLENGQAELFIKEVRKCLKKWTADGYPQLWIENMVRQIVYMMQKTGYKNLEREDYEFALEDAFFYALDADDLIQSLEGMFSGGKETLQGHSARADMESFYKEVTEYMQEHLAEPLTLQYICRQFGVSQTYLSKAFRRCGEASFSNYLTMLRIEAAKKLMREQEGIFIRDVAALTGFSDQFYFSRIFRSVTGMRPSDYSRQIEMKE